MQRGRGQELYLRIAHAAETTGKRRQSAPVEGFKIVSSHILALQHPGRYKPCSDPLCELCGDDSMIETIINWAIAALYCADRDAALQLIASRAANLLDARENAPSAERQYRIVETIDFVRLRLIPPEHGDKIAAQLADRLAAHGITAEEVIRRNEAAMHQRGEVEWVLESARRQKEAVRRIDAKEASFVEWAELRALCREHLGNAYDAAYEVNAPPDFVEYLVSNLSDYLDVRGR